MRPHEDLEVGHGAHGGVQRVCREAALERGESVRKSLLRYRSACEGRHVSFDENPGGQLPVPLGLLSQQKNVQVLDYRALPAINTPPIPFDTGRSGGLYSERSRSLSERGEPCTRCRH